MESKCVRRMEFAAAIFVGNWGAYLVAHARRSNLEAANPAPRIEAATLGGSVVPARVRAVGRRDDHRRWSGTSLTIAFRTRRGQPCAGGSSGRNNTAAGSTHSSTV